MNRQEATLLQGIDTIIVRVSNLETSKNWYQDNLGFGLLWHDPVTKLAILDTNGPTSLTLWQTDKKVEADKDTASFPIFKTVDAVSLRQDLLQKGLAVEEIMQDNYVKYFLFFDPDGNVLEACEVLG
ncbi:VOC family protein [Pontibacter vulgaris]|uniref:VOC family protein n=1 Tax=Pontibacter vulgaris TaxID=2905679 RepID=UPI001FA6C707|nr:VOC family protein [Pontibacter vulgaris]